jgi:putative SOS response-associated peptidase YedK
VSGLSDSPAILHRQDYGQWLHGSVYEAMDLLRPYPADRTIAYRVSNTRLAPGVSLTHRTS